MKNYSELSQKRTALCDVVPLKQPFGLFIDPTNFCNFHCSFCPRNFSDFSNYAGPYAYMEMQVFNKIVSDIEQFPEKLKVIRLYYLGEPLLNPNFIKMLEIILQKNITQRVEITTNASLLTKEKAFSIIQLAKKYPETDIYLRFSIYSTLQQKHFEITSNPMSVEKIKDNILNFQNLKNENNCTNLLSYAKMLDTFDENDNNHFMNFYENCVDQICLEKPMEWSSFENRDLLRKAYKDTVLKIYIYTNNEGRGGA